MKVTPGKRAHRVLRTHGPWRAHVCFEKRAKRSPQRRRLRDGNVPPAGACRSLGFPCFPPPPARPRAPRHPAPPRPGASSLLRAAPARPAARPGNTSLPRNETLGETKGAALGLPQAAPGRGRPKLPSPTFPRSTGDSSPRADALAPALRRRRAAHPPPPGNLSLGRGGRGGYECACARDSRSTAHPRPLCTERPLPAARDT